MGGLNVYIIITRQQFYNCTPNQDNINNLKQAFFVESEKQSAALHLIASAKNKGVIYNSANTRCLYESR